MLLPTTAKQYLLSGESAGGMMVQALMCESEVIPATVDAAVDILGGIGADYMDSAKCSKSQPLPFLKLHGMTDPFITYDKQVRLGWGCLPTCRC
jgi:poly(3-hydroxybutyrate) depolymerase